jgi:transcription-repair coupling factor (superfamily II helicase)
MVAEMSATTTGTAAPSEERRPDGAARTPARVGAGPYSALTGVFGDGPMLHSLAGRRAGVVSVPEVAQPFVLAALARTARHGATTLVVVPTTAAAERIAHDLEEYAGRGRVAYFPAWETLPFERVSPAIDTMGRRLEVLHRLTTADAPLAVVAPVRALVQRLGPSGTTTAPVVVRRGGEVDPDRLVRRLVAAGYRREFQVEHRGEVARRGSIVDVFPSTADDPVRIDLWGDEVDRLTRFAVADQRSTADLDEVEIFPARELILGDREREVARALVARHPWGRAHWDRLADGEVFDGMESWLPWLTDEERLLPDVLAEGSRAVVVEPSRAKGRATELIDEEIDLAASLAQTWGAVPPPRDGAATASGFPRLHLDFDRLLARFDGPVLSMSAVPERPDVPSLDAAAWEPVVGDGSRLVERLLHLQGQGFRIVVGADGGGSAQRLVDTLGAEGVSLRLRSDPSPDVLLEPGGHVVPVPLESGFVLPGQRLAVLTEHDVTGRRRAHRRARPRRRGSLASFEDLSPGDYVVHHHHGVARYGGMVHRAIMGAERDYLVLEYRGTDKLYLPSDQIDLVRPYSGGETPSLSRMGGADFARTKAKVRSAVDLIAQELVVLYQRRITTPGHAFAPDTPWQTEMEDLFGYQETPDQRTAIEDVKGDMESAVPMDRLVCGDVGFGKTEVAIRAAFKAAVEGKQVAVLVPTTLLAQQHHQTFSERFADFPVRVEVLSRFLTPAQQRAVVKGLADGSVDVVIGTHRLLSADVRFARLGLLVVDEEQRFGVQHKELIKQMAAHVDVLTLTATPIPRTLEMSLTGIRDLSLLNTPPADRQPILTYVGEYDERAVAEAIRRELLREGQAFFVHNRVADIDQVAADLRELVPEARVGVAHGQMDEGSLERVVLDFWEGELDVLVCTTIIESGIDMPTVNTLVVDRADLLGLGQLHQIRGRVGRSGKRAYAYLFHPHGRVLSEEAYERLKTIGEATELGSGFRIAMRDLEIRGAGNLLGEDQSGHIAAVGYDLYCQMVSEAVAKLKGEPIVQPVEVTIDLPVSAHLPPSYVGRDEQRLEAYRRLGAVTSRPEVADIEAEWLDRYGPPPPEAAALLGVAVLRAECVRLGVREVNAGNGRVIRLVPVELKRSEQLRLTRLAPRAVWKEATGELQLPLPKGEGLASWLADFLVELVPAAPSPSPSTSQERVGEGEGEPADDGGS